VQTPEEFAMLTAQERRPYQTPVAGSFDRPKIDPDNPPWGVATAIFVWLASLILLAIVPVFFVVPYAAVRGTVSVKDPTVVFLLVFSTLPAHLLTVVIVWAVVTKFGKRPFWETLGWSWGKYFGLWTSIGLGVALFFASGAVAHFLGGDKVTPLEELLNSSPAARYAIAFLATLTAPFVEEFVFRGVLYSALQRAIGSGVAVILVATLFAAVHVLQYRTNLGVIAAIGLLSLVLSVIRAVSGRLLPCFIVHLVFNGIQSVIILWERPGNRPVVPPEQAIAFVLSLIRSMNSLI
jgi:membrane protease YdiL (CAAX protease family)